MFVTDNSCLIWYLYFDLCTIIKDDALASQSGFQARVDCSIDKVLLLIRDLLEILFSFKNVYMAGAAGANPAAIMIQMDVVVFRDLQDRIPLLCIFNHLGRNIRIFKLESNSSQSRGVFVVTILYNMIKTPMFEKFFFRP